MVEIAYMCHYRKWIKVHLLVIIMLELRDSKHVAAKPILIGWD
jgi:hypothetical protein